MAAASSSSSGSRGGTREEQTTSRAAPEARRPALPSRSSSAEEQERFSSSRRSSSASASGRPAAATLAPAAASSVSSRAADGFASKRSAIADYLSHLAPLPASASGSLAVPRASSPVLAVLLRSLSGAALLGLLLGAARALAALRRAQSLRGASARAWQALVNTVSLGTKVTYL
jgi:hypothetical protein